MSVVFGTQVTYIIFFDFSGEKRDVEHIRSLGYIAGASIFIDDFNTVILLFYTYCFLYWIWIGSILLLSC